MRIINILLLLVSLSACGNQELQADIADFTQELNSSLSLKGFLFDKHFVHWERIHVIQPYSNASKILKSHGVKNSQIVDNFHIEARDDIILIIIVHENMVVGLGTLYQRVCTLSSEALILRDTALKLKLAKSTETECRFEKTDRNL